MENIDKLLGMLPDGLEAAAHETNALKRKREIKTAIDLLRLVFLYVAHGLTYLEISVIAKVKGIAQISDVGFMKRFAKCGELMCWLLASLSTQATAHYKKPDKFIKYDIKALDASVVTSGGKVRITHRFHFSIDIFKLRSDQYKITTEKKGESLTNFKVSPDDLFLGDRAYGTKTSMEHCLTNKGNFIFRIRRNAFDVYNRNGKKIDLIERLGKLKSGKKMNLNCFFVNSEKLFVPIRICAMHKPKEIVESPEDDTEFMNNFIVVVTSVLDKHITATDILGLYRLRWQVELYFKRLKSLMGFGDIPNKKEEHIMTWLNAKLVVAILLEITTAQVDFSPSGRRREKTEHMA